MGVYNVEIAMNIGNLWTISVSDEDMKKVSDVLVPVFKGISAKAELFLKEQYAETQNEWYKNKLSALLKYIPDKQLPDNNEKIQYVTVKFNRSFTEEEESQAKKEENVEKLADLYGHYEASFKTMDFEGNGDPRIYLKMQDGSTCGDALLIGYMFQEYFRECGFQNIKVKQVFVYKDEEDMMLNSENEENKNEK